VWEVARTVIAGGMDAVCSEPQERGDACATIM
jgi:hypothetical protein